MVGRCGVIRLLQFPFSERTRAAGKVLAAYLFEVPALGAEQGGRHEGRTWRAPVSNIEGWAYSGWPLGLELYRPGLRAGDVGLFPVSCLGIQALSTPADHPSVLGGLEPSAGRFKVALRRVAVQSGSLAKRTRSGA